MTFRPLLRFARVLKQALSVIGVIALCGCRSEPAAPLLSGAIQADEVHVGSRQGGRVAALFAREGDHLTNGQMLVQLQAPELVAMHAEAIASLQELEAGPRPQEVTAAKHDWESVAAEFDLARADALRADDLFEAKTISKSEFDRAVSRSAALEKGVAAAKSRYELMLAGTRPERLAQARARVQEISARLQEMHISAPTNCLLEVLSVKVGDVTAPNRPVATLLLPQLWVRVYVSELWLARLPQTVKVRVDGFPNRTFHGQVVQVNRQAEFTPRNTQTVAERIKQVFGVKIVLDDPDHVLRAGMHADVDFGVAERP